MKVIFAILSAIMVFALSCISRASEKKPGLPQQVIFADTIDFKTQVQPIFVKHCSPCHFNGGKMYEKLPFDEVRTIVVNSIGILRRIKDENDKILITSFIEEFQASNK